VWQGHEEKDDFRSDTAPRQDAEKKSLATKQRETGDLIRFFREGCGKTGIRGEFPLAM
jgi:hypothetical protein